MKRGERFVNKLNQGGQYRKELVFYSYKSQRKIIGMNTMNMCEWKFDFTVQAKGL